MHHEGGALLPAVERQQKAQRRDEMGRGLEQLGALDEGFANEVELKPLEIAQAAMDQLGRGRGGGPRIVALLGEHDFQPAARGVAGDGRAMDAAANDEKIEALRGHVGGR